VDEEAGATAHVVGGGRVQLVAVRHALEGLHVAQGVGALGEGADTHLALQYVPYRTIPTQEERTDE
jgi:hypothetical protein